MSDMFSFQYLLNFTGLALVLCSLSLNCQLMVGYERKFLTGDLSNYTVFLFLSVYYYNIIYGESEHKRMS